MINTISLCLFFSLILTMASQAQPDWLKEEMPGWSYVRSLDSVFIEEIYARENKVYVAWRDHKVPGVYQRVVSSDGLRSIKPVTMYDPAGAFYITLCDPDLNIYRFQTGFDGRYMQISRDLDQSYKETYKLSYTTAGSQKFDYFYIHPGNPEYMYHTVLQPGINFRLAVSSDHGQSWELADFSGLPEVERMLDTANCKSLDYDISHDLRDPSVWYVQLRGYKCPEPSAAGIFVLRTEDNGKSFQKVLWFPRYPGLFTAGEVSEGYFDNISGQNQIGFYIYDRKGKKKDSVNLLKRLLPDEYIRLLTGKRIGMYFDRPHHAYTDPDMYTIQFQEKDYDSTCKCFMPKRQWLFLTTDNGASFEQILYTDRYIGFWPRHLDGYGKAVWLSTLDSIDLTNLSRNTGKATLWKWGGTTSVEDNPVCTEASLTVANPVAGSFTPRLPAGERINRLELLDIMGNSVYMLDYGEAGVEPGPVSLPASFAEGFYLLRINSGIKVFSAKIILRY